jgi:hypothetical protein
MIVLLLFLLLTAVLFGLGFMLKALWIVAAVLLAMLLIGFVARSGERATWYRW